MRPRNLSVLINIILFACGAWLLQQQALLPPLAWGLALPVIAALAWVTRNFARRSLIGLLCLMTGFAWAALFAHVRLADELPAEWEGRDVQIEGVIARLPQAYERGQRFEFDVERVLTSGAKVPQRIALTWWGSAAKDGRSGSQTALHPGERWRLAVRLRRPHGGANPHGFDYEAWLFERGIRATGYASQKRQPARGCDGAPARLLGRARA